MFKQISIIIMIGFICSSCTFPHQKYGAVDLTKLNSSEEKYGIVVFRSMFFDKANLAEKFINDESSIKLDSSSDVFIFAKNPLENKYLGYMVGGSWPYESEWEEKKKRFTIQKFVMGWSKSVPEILMPEYFYTVKMLAEGDYYFSSISFARFRREFDEKERAYNFHVKAGKINYLGDLYFAAPKIETVNFWTESEYSTEITFLNKSAEASEFMHKYHPEIKLPFITNLIRFR